MSNKTNIHAPRAITSKSEAAKAARAASKAKAQIEAAAELEGRTGPLGILATEAVTEIEKEYTQTSTPAHETPATDLEEDRTEIEKEYGEKSLNEFLATPDFIGDLQDQLSSHGYEISIVEAMLRRIEGKAKKSAPILTKSTYVAVEGGVGPTKRVWEIAADMKGAKRSEVLAACAAEGIGANTAKTQYQKFMEAGRSKLTGSKA